MNHFVGLDIGSANVKAAVAEIGRDHKVSLISLLKIPSSGVRRGVVENITEAAQAVSGILADLKQIDRGAVKRISLAAGSPDVKVHYSRGVVAVSRADDEIYQDDVTRVKQSAQAISLPANRMILHIINKEFIVDGITGIADPLGMMGKRLEVNTLIVDAFSPAIKNLKKTVETLGGEVEDVILGSLADAAAVLSKHQKELGVALVNIGASKTGVAVFEANQLIHAAVIPVGAGNITNDIAIGLRIPIEAAESIKLTYGSALAKEVAARDVIELEKIDPRTRGVASRKFVCEIIEERLAEILELVNNEIKQIGKASQLPAGVVLVGGGAKTPNITELARQEMHLSAQIGIPDAALLPPVSTELALQVEDPEFTTAIGLLMYDGEAVRQVRRVNPKILPKLRKILNYFIP